MKYKHKLIQQIKNKYGVPHLFFFKGTKRSEVRHNNDQIWFSGYTICSLDPYLDKKCKESEDLQIESQLTHHELEDVLKVLAENSRYDQRGWPTIHKPVLLEPYGIEVNDLISLKSAYLLTYLSGI